MKAEHVEVYRQPGRFASWPANYGIWSWGNEFVVSFTLGYKDLSGGFHARDKSRPFVTKQARSLDGGKTWDVGKAATPWRRHGVESSCWLWSDIMLIVAKGTARSSANPPRRTKR